MMAVKCCATFFNPTIRIVAEDKAVGPVKPQEPQDPFREWQCEVDVSRYRQLSVEPHHRLLALHLQCS